MSANDTRSRRKAGRGRRARVSAWGVAGFAFASLALALPFISSAGGADTSSSGALAGLPPTTLTEDEAIVHALNRLGFGPRPGDVEHIRQIGLARWIDAQLHPASIDDSAMDARLTRFPSLTMSAQEIVEKYPRPVLAARAQGVTVQQYRRQVQQNQNQQAADLANAIMNAGSDNSSSSAAGAQPADSDSASVSSQSSAPPPPADAADPAGTGLPGGGFGSRGAVNPAMDSMDARLPARLIAELAMAKMDRAIYSERQLQEQMVDFWFNHFNVYAGKGQDRWFLTSYERDAIRPHALGKFRDLLEATAKSPAMLFYLDNWQSVDPDAFARMQEEQEARRMYRARRFGLAGPGPGGQQPAANQGNRQERGLNENYGRELMELHTLGVDGGYTQQDVINVARAFTGWTIRTPLRDPEFFFNPRLHDPNPKIVLGRKIDAGGIRDGEEVLDLLAGDPHTAHHISLELAQHFVSDNPPPALVDRMTQTWLQTGGDIRAVLHTMIYSPEFWSKDAYRAKIKAPFELVASAARAVNADTDSPAALVVWTARIGEPLYQCQPPTGYSDKSQDWVNTGALLNRLNYSLALSNGRMPGVSVDIAALLDSGSGSASGSGDLAASSAAPGKAQAAPSASSGAAAPDPNAILDRAIAVLLSGEVSAQTRQTLENQMSDPRILQASLDDPVREINQGVIAGLVLGAPEFQRR